MWDLPSPGVEPVSPALTGGFLSIVPLGKSLIPFFEKLCREGNGTPLQYSCLENPMDGGAWWAAVHGVARSLTRLNDFPFTFHFHELEKEMATHSSTLAWKIPWTEEPGGLQSMGLLGVSDTTEQLHFHFSLSCIGKGNGNPPQGSCLENPRDGGAWWAAVHGSHRVGHN